MRRGAVLIGVGEAKGRSALPAVRRDINAMQGWARAQRFDHVKALVDDDGPVTFSAVFKAVEAAIDVGLDQLMIYFAGHGFYNNSTEYWLLSEAPRNPNEAVNLAESIRLARRHQLEHLVIVSDACRTPPGSVDLADVKGGSIFFAPDELRERVVVDEFYATGLGAAALEVADVEAAIARHTSAYTTVFVRALHGDPVRVARQLDDGSVVVRPGPLSDELPDLVSDHLDELGVPDDYYQEPTAKLALHDFWLSRIDAGVPAAPDERTTPSGSRGYGTMVGGLIRGESEALTPARGPAGDTLTLGAAFIDAMASNLEPHGSTHHETGSGIKVNEGAIETFDGRDIEVDFGSSNGPADLALVMADGEVRHAVVTLDSGRSAVVPIIGGYITGLTMSSGALVAVAWEPMDYSPTWPGADVGRVRRVRAAAAAASQLNQFRPSDEELRTVLGHLEELPASDLALEIYAAYALLEQSIDPDVLSAFTGRGWERHPLGDLRLVAGLYGAEESLARPALPLLSRGWAFTSTVLQYASEQWTQDLELFYRSRISSPWTLYSEEARDRLLEVTMEGVLDQQ